MKKNIPLSAMTITQLQALLKQTKGKKRQVIQDRIAKTSRMSVARQNRYMAKRMKYPLASKLADMMF
jgi:hypothetical protein